MRFTYVGPEIAVAIFGHTFANGVAVEVTDGHAIAKLSNHPEFTADGKPAADNSLPAVEAPKRRGRPPKVRPDADQG
jgi:hypothetical protein